MLNPRNVVVLTLVIAVLSLAWACVELARPPDSHGMGADSYGTRANGQRGLFETLHDLDVPVERTLGPPTAVIGRKATLVLWKPDPDLVQVEPAYLRALARWVEQGGRVVVAPDAKPGQRRPIGLSGRRERSGPEFTVLGELGLDRVSVHTLDLEALTRKPDGPAAESQPVRHAGRAPSERDTFDDQDVRHLSELLRGVTRPVVTRDLKVEAKGAFAPLGASVSTLEVPSETMQVLDVGASSPDGTFTFDDPAGKEQVLAALYRRGKGELVVVALPALAENGRIARRDNSVLAVELLAGPGRPVVFDEFYHGLTIRGNPLWLFTQRGYAATTLCLLGLLGLWIWREAVFLGPSLAPRVHSRRSIGEYVDAMARFLNRGGSSQAFLLREVRSGVLHALRDELHLSPMYDHVEDVAAALARREPARARALVETMAAVDEALARKVVLREPVAVELFKRMSRCL